MYLKTLRYVRFGLVPDVRLALEEKQIKALLQFVYIVFTALILIAGAVWLAGPGIISLMAAIIVVWFTLGIVEDVFHSYQAREELMHAYGRGWQERSKK